jgi:hypothetical protein
MALRAKKSPSLALKPAARTRRFRVPMVFHERCFFAEMDF